MKNYMSNNIKACVFPGNMLQPMTKITKDAVLTLQKFFYQSERMKDEDSIPYGPPRNTIIDFTVRTLPDGYMKKIYEALSYQDEQVFSFVMDAVFSDQNEEEVVLKDYNNAFIISGYVVNVEENYNAATSFFTSKSPAASKKQEELMTTQISLLINTIVYVGDNEKYIPFNMK